MRVSEKSGKRTSKSSSLKYQKLILADKKCNDVEAVIFGTEIDARENTLEVFHTYYISNAYVKKTAPPFDKKRDYKYSWTLNSRTEIKEIQTEDNQISAPNYDFIPFSGLHTPKEFNKPIDILAIALKMKPPKEVNSPYGLHTIQEIYLIDESFKPVCLTMWGHKVHDECLQIAEVIEDRPIILGSKLIVQTKRGLSLSSRDTSTFKINPQLPEAEALKEWAESNETEIKSAIVNCLTYESSPKSFVGLHEIVTNIQISELTKNLQLNENFYYMSCDACNKKIDLYDRDEKIICDKPTCGQEGFSTPRAIAYVELDDNTKSLSAVMFADIVEKIFSCNAAQLMNYTVEVNTAALSTLPYSIYQRKNG
ncbi:hypothetical protein CsatA_026446 [Cannabis sativa]